jgi:hypothetical protein
MFASAQSLCALSPIPKMNSSLDEKHLSIFQLVKEADDDRSID